jgi:hypothetical protein
MVLAISLLFLVTPLSNTLIIVFCKKLNIVSVTLIFELLILKINSKSSRILKNKLNILTNKLNYSLVKFLLAMK